MFVMVPEQTVCCVRLYKWQIFVADIDIMIPCGLMCLINSHYSDVIMCAMASQITGPCGLMCLINSHYSDVIMCAMASQITGVSIVYTTVCSDASKNPQSSTSMAFVRGNSPHKGSVTRKMLLFDDVSMLYFRTAPEIQIREIAFFLNQ